MEVFKPHELYTKQCLNKPGWFAPVEAVKAATYLSKTLVEFFQMFLAIDWWELEGSGNIFLLSPCLTTERGPCRHR
jgi:hypothetical protein